MLANFAYKFRCWPPLQKPSVNFCSHQLCYAEIGKAAPLLDGASHVTCFNQVKCLRALFLFMTWPNPINKILHVKLCYVCLHHSDWLFNILQPIRALQISVVQQYTGLVSQVSISLYLSISTYIFTPLFAFCFLYQPFSLSLSSPPFMFDKQIIVWVKCISSTTISHEICSIFFSNTSCCTKTSENISLKSKLWNFNSSLPRQKQQKLFRHRMEWGRV